LAAEPEPLSLMPGPAVTLSRWPPTMSVFAVLPPGQSAILQPCQMSLDARDRDVRCRGERRLGRHGDDAGG
jgi:hypothetical protein